MAPERKTVDLLGKRAVEHPETRAVDHPETLPVTPLGTPVVVAAAEGSFAAALRRN